MSYGFEVGAKVYHVKDVGGQVGFVTEIDSLYDLGGVTTCRVVWALRIWKKRKLFHKSIEAFISQTSSLQSRGKHGIVHF